MILLDSYNNFQQFRMLKTLRKNRQGEKSILKNVIRVPVTLQ